MSDPIIIIGSGFAAYQLIKNIRRQDEQVPIEVFTGDDGAEYNKPDLSHVFTKQQGADALVQQSGAAFAEQYNVTLHANTWVDNINIQDKCVYSNGQAHRYSKLVFATGASAFIPPVAGNGARHIVTLNSLDEYRRAQHDINHADTVLIIGGGLIGIELAMDLQSSGKKVLVVEPNSRILSNVAPDFVALKLEQQLISNGVELILNNIVDSVSTNTDKTLCVTTKTGLQYQVDCIISAAGLRPNTHLAQQAGVAVNRGINVDSQLRTSATDVYALGDCAEINGKVMAYLQPIVLSANTLAKTLLGQDAQLNFPAMMVKVKTPSYPIQVGGVFNADSTWKVDFSSQGIRAEAFDEQHNLTGFVVTDSNVQHAFSLLRKVA
ncbi:NADH:flavorubredoxin reductase NorW [Shewanella intestini]|uniref:NADH:flavorubredoxin reductase NorW n=1 Tax=Shewanella intestini TaxID=2017544 RepID=A0ABS5I411_9GAMM|nr:MULTISPECIES: NADH:flavorubredoxin reductase NorW [Shewanella]MBR9728568.1 NADH:flavorubredoxin reductase NorW [Shewanella intestini]MRG36387.1 NADH:flavorubredoxin reductase NorW [Shewanella sp. XMDDZSB0408]